MLIKEIIQRFIKVKMYIVEYTYVYKEKYTHMYIYIMEDKIQ